MDGEVSLLGARAEVASQVLGMADEVGAQVLQVAAGASQGWTPGRSAGPRLVLVDAVPDRGAADWAELPWGEVPGPGRGRPAGGQVVVVHLAGEQSRAQEVAIATGADAVVELPRGRGWLAGKLSGVAPGPVLAVVGAVGGAGASAVAIACAVAAGPDCLLIDADPWSAGLDLPLGIPEDRGGRWSAVPDTGEPLVAESLRTVLPRTQGISILTGPMPDPVGGRIAAAVGAGRSGFRRAVIDCGRSPAGVALHGRDRVVLVTPATLAGVVSSRRVLAEVGAEQVTLVVRPTGWLPIDEVVELLGVRRALDAPRLARHPEGVECGEVLAGRLGRDVARLGARIWAAVA